MTNESFTADDQTVSTMNKARIAHEIEGLKGRVLVDGFRCKHLTKMASIPADVNCSLAPDLLRAILGCADLRMSSPTVLTF